MPASHGEACLRASGGDPGGTCQVMPPQEQPHVPVPTPVPRVHLQVTRGRGGARLVRRACLPSTNRETPSPEAAGSVQRLYTHTCRKQRMRGRVCLYI